MFSYLFIILIAIYIFSLVCVKDFGSFLIKLFFLCYFKTCLYNLENSPLSFMSSVNIVS